MKERLKIPDKERHKFSQPLGKLIVGTREETIPKVENLIKEYKEADLTLNFYLVGDIVTQDFLANEFLRPFIKLCIVDEKTQRSKIKITFEEFFENILEFENPEGGVSSKSFKLLENIVKSNKITLLKITKGEEDLLVLPLVSCLPINENTKNIVFYGQPPLTDSKHPIPQGIVIVDVNKRIQKTIKKFISIMEQY
ncbi:MAG: DUF359 domain-containing protein [Candidatus Hodarchaeota archaeon]